MGFHLFLIVAGVIISAVCSITGGLSRPTSSIGIASYFMVLLGVIVSVMESVLYSLELK